MPVRDVSTAHTPTWVLEVWYGGGLGVGVRAPFIARGWPHVPGELTAVAYALVVRMC